MAQVCANKRTGKQTAAQWHDGLLLSDGKEQARDMHNNTGECQTHWVQEVKHKSIHTVWLPSGLVLEQTKLNTMIAISSWKGIYRLIGKGHKELFQGSQNSIL